MAKVLAPFSPSLARPFGFPTGWKFTLGIVFAAQLFSAVGFSMVFPFLPLYVESLSSRFALSTEVLAGLVIAVQSVTMMIAAPIWGVVADRFGRKKMILRAMIGGGIFMVSDGFRSERGTTDTVTSLARRRHGYSFCKQCVGSGKYAS